MTAGKLLHTLSLPGIKSLVINPCEFVMGVVSETVDVYDLTNFERISSLDLDADKLVFTPDGEGLVAVCKDSLKVMKWEPMSIEYEIGVEWKGDLMRDCKVLGEHAVACSSNGSMVEVWGFQMGRRGRGVAEVVEGLKDGVKVIGRTSSRQPEEKPKSVPSQYPKLSKTEEFSHLSQLSASLPVATKIEIPKSEPQIPEASFNLNTAQQGNQTQQNKFKYVPSCDGNKVLGLDLSKFVLKVTLFD